jgi:hypothetical protein
METSTQRSNVSPSRRFLLLPEETVDGPGQGRRIRRYQLACVGRRQGPKGVDLATARFAADLGQAGRV